jgi:hypothetical protein
MPSGIPAAWAAADTASRVGSPTPLIVHEWECIVHVAGRMSRATSTDIRLTLPVRPYRQVPHRKRRHV